MQNELQIITQNLELAKQEPKHSENGSLQIALQSPQIHKVGDEELKQVLRYCMILTGIRSNNMPDEIEKTVLLNFIRQNFAFHTPQEIKLAFEMAVAGKLDVEAKVYENFSCEFFGRIMTSYRKWSKDEVKYTTKPTEVPQISDKNTDWGNVWADILNAAKLPLIEKKVIPLPVYDWLVEKGLLKLTNLEKQKLMKRAEVLYRLELDERFIAKKNSPNDIQELVILKDGKPIPEGLKLKLQIRAKVLAVRELAKVLSK
jgi:hypothetical protein